MFVCYIKICLHQKCILIQRLLYLFFIAVSQPTFKQHLLSFISNLFSDQHFSGAVKNDEKKATMDPVLCCFQKYECK